MDLDRYEWIWIDVGMDIWICGYLDIWINEWMYGYLDIWMYIFDDRVSLEGRGLLPSSPALSRIFIRGSAPQTPHRVNGYTHSHLDSVADACENTVSKTFAIGVVRECSIKDKLGDQRARRTKVGRSTCENACIR